MDWGTAEGEAKIARFKQRQAERESGERPELTFSGGQIVFWGVALLAPMVLVGQFLSTFDLSTGWKITLTILAGLYLIIGMTTIYGHLEEKDARQHDLLYGSDDPPT